MQRYNTKNVNKNAIYDDAVYSKAFEAYNYLIEKQGNNGIILYKVRVKNVATSALKIFISISKSMSIIFTWTYSLKDKYRKDLL